MSVAITEEPISQLETSIHYSTLPHFARWLLNELFLAPQHSSRPPLDSDITPVQRLNVTLRRRGAVRGSMSGKGGTLQEQLISAVQSVAEDGRFGGSIVEDELKELSIEVWVQEGSSSLPLSSRTQEGTLDLGAEGIEVRLGAKAAYYKPSVSLTSRFLTQTQMLNSVCKKARLPSDAWRKQETEVFVTKWSCYVLPPKTTISVSVDRLRHVDPAPLRYETIDQWGRDAAMYLARNQKASGEITYLVDPITGRALTEPSNAVRMSGCFFALSSALAHWTDGLQSELERACVLLYRNIASRGRLWENNCRVVLDGPQQNGPAKLGTTALFTCGLMAGPLATLVPEEQHQLLNTLKAMQNQEGRFATHIGSSTINGRSENYFSGQALLALVLAAKAGDSDSLERCNLAFTPYKALFERNPTSAFVGWHIDVWARLAEMTGRRDYANFAFSQADWLIGLLLTNSSRKDWIGGFSRNGSEPTASSIVFIEALCCALALAESVGDAMRMESYITAIRCSLPFCQRLRAESIPELYRTLPERSSGGIVMSMRDLSIRCDFVQHFITMCLQLKRVAHLVLGEAISR